MSWDAVAILVFMLIVIAMGIGLLFGNLILGPRSDNPDKADEFECGSPLKDSSRKRFNVKFYLVALIFLVFDLEVVYLYPWGVLFRKLGLFGIAEMVIFLGILVIGLAYVWKKGALDWS